MKQGRFPTGWDEARVRRVLTHYEEQTEDEALAEDEAAFDQGPAAILPALAKIHRFVPGTGPHVSRPGCAHSPLD